jgi:hypothetical protein
MRRGRELSKPLLIVTTGRGFVFEGEEEKLRGRRGNPMMGMCCRFREV